MGISKDIQAYCQHKKIRHNAVREIVADFLQKMKYEATSEEIWLALYKKGYKISASSVYIHLRWLWENGFVGRSKEDYRQATFFVINRQRLQPRRR